MKFFDENNQDNLITEAADAEVTWYNGNKKIVADGERIIEVVEVCSKLLMIQTII